MIRPILVAMALMVPGVAVAEGDEKPDGYDKADTPKEHCAQFSKDAEILMEKRQNGRSMREMMEGAGNEVTERMVEKAYGEPQWPQGHRQDTIRDFGDDAYQYCWERISR